MESKEKEIEEFQNDIIDNLFNGGTYELAEALYNAGYRKTFTSELASDIQKAYKSGYYWRGENINTMPYELQINGIKYRKVEE